MPRRPPNILLLFTDQQRHDTVGALGNDVIRTPTLDRLAREGTAFTRCYTPSPVCVSARCSLVTGLLPHRTGCTDNGQPNPQDVLSFMERLAALGYRTHGIGKMHFAPDLRRLWGFESREFSEEGIGSPDDRFRQHIDAHGFRHVQDPHGVRSEMYYVPQPSQLPAHLHHTAWVGDRSIEFLKTRDRNRPFFLWSSFIKPHPPFEVPTPWNKLYRAAEMAPPFRPEGFGALLTYWNRFQNRYKYRDRGYDEMLARTMRAHYYACISFIDFHVGRILEALGADADHTLIAFTSDHGELLGDYGSYGKRCMLDAAARIPMLLRWPERFAAGARCATPCSLIDLFPTFLSAAGDGHPRACDEGTDLGSVASGAESDRIAIGQFQKGGQAVYLAASREAKYVYSAPDRREWYFETEGDGRESLDRANNPFYRTRMYALRERLWAQLRKDGCREPLDGDGWRTYPPPEFPDSPDWNLLFQDDPKLQQYIDALGPYAKRVSGR